MKHRVAQTILKDAGYYLGVIDGQFGPNSARAAHKYYDYPNSWNNSRLSVGVIQVACIREGISVGAVDGIWGNKTQTGYQELIQRMGIEDPYIVDVDKDVNFSAHNNNWPRQSYSSMVAYYGNVGENQTSLQLPYTMMLAWDESIKVNKITCHRKVKDSLGRVLEGIRDHYGLHNIQTMGLDQFGGMLNVRKMRGGSSWSIHSWGAAIDLDPNRNRLRWGRDRAYMARPEFEPFWKMWEMEGWTSLGRERNYDWMHIQAAHL